MGSYDLCLTECLLEPECFFWAFDFTLDKESCKLYSNLLSYATSAVPYETVAGPMGCDADGKRNRVAAGAALLCLQPRPLPIRMLEGNVALLCRNVL